eukprot:scaffold95772_cov66-Phaeocystis_antarctica.AAC.4
MPIWPRSAKLSLKPPMRAKASRRTISGPMLTAPTCIKGMAASTPALPVPRTQDGMRCSGSPPHPSRQLSPVWCMPSNPIEPPIRPSEGRASKSSTARAIQSVELGRQLSPCSRMSSRPRAIAASRLYARTS